MEIKRRQFLQWATGIAATAPFSLAGEPSQAVVDEDAAAPTIAADEKHEISLLLHEPNGTPLGKERAKTLIARDLANDPLPQPISAATGRARVCLAGEPIQIAVRLNVPGFGEVMCYADNQGHGYIKRAAIEFVTAAAQTRLLRVRECHSMLVRSGLTRDPELEELIEAAAALMPRKSGGGQIAAAYASLAKSLHAGEKLTRAAARHRIGRLNASRKTFLFGCLAADAWQRPRAYQDAFTNLFNLGVLSWYTWNQMPEAATQKISYSRMDESLKWCKAHKIQPKGFGYVYLTPGATPEWLRKLAFNEALPIYEQVVKETAQRYDGKLPYIEIINEAHDKANLFHFSHEQILDLTAAACSEARRGSSTVNRVINNCCLWAEYARRENRDGTRRWSPFRYLKDCVSSDAAFERIGLQLYYPQHDLFEIDRMLDRFKTFGKPLQISEISCSSAEGEDATSMRPHSATPGWHGPWTETTQADWLEAIYTLCYSKPEFEAVGYWDLADVGGHFWPYGGLLKKDLTPKESYSRLLALKKSWGLT